MNLLVDFIENFELFLKTDDNLTIRDVDFNGYENYSGCYFIDSHYIGRTKNCIKWRINEHLNELYEAIKFRDSDINKFKIQNLAKKLIKNKKISVKSISDDPEEENELVEIYSKSFNLTNSIINRKKFDSKETYKIVGGLLLENIKKEYNSIIGLPNNHISDTKYINSLKQEIKELTIKNNQQEKELIFIAELNGNLNDEKHKLNKKINAYKDEVKKLKKGITDQDLDNCLILV